MAEPAVECSCGLQYSEAEFLELMPPDGGEWQALEPDPGAHYRPEGYRLQFKNCPVCGSTLAVERDLVASDELGAADEADLGSAELGGTMTGNYAVKKQRRIGSMKWDEYKTGLGKTLAEVMFDHAVEDAQKPSGYHYAKIVLFRGDKEVKRWGAWNLPNLNTETLDKDYPDFTTLLQQFSEEYADGQLPARFVLEWKPLEPYYEQAKQWGFDEGDRGPEHIKALVESIQDGIELPPLIVCGNTLMDGRHRAHAAHKLKIKSVPVIDIGKVWPTCATVPLEVESPIIFGEKLKEILSTDEAYRILTDTYDSWSAGGCWILAEALQQLWPGASLWAVTSLWGVEHVAVEKDGVLYDSDGASTHTEMEDRYTKLFQSSPGYAKRGAAVVQQFTEKMQNGDVRADRRPEISTEIAAFIRKSFEAGAGELGVLTPETLDLSKRVRSLIAQWQKEGEIPRGRWKVWGSDREANARQNDDGSFWHGPVNVQAIELPNYQVFDRQPRGHEPSNWWPIERKLEELFKAEGVNVERAYASRQAFVHIHMPTAYGEGTQFRREEARFIKEKNLLQLAYPDRYKQLILEAPDDVYQVELERARAGTAGTTRVFDPTEHGWHGYTHTPTHYSRIFRDGVEGVLVPKRSEEQLTTRRDPIGTRFDPMFYDANRARMEALTQHVLEAEEKHPGSNYLWLVWLHRPRANRYDKLKGGYAETLSDAVQAAHDAAGEPLLLDGLNDVTYGTTREHMVLADLGQTSSDRDIYKKNLSKKKDCSTAKSKYDWLRFDVCAVRRTIPENAETPPMLDRPNLVAEFIRDTFPEVRTNQFETFSVIALDSKNVPVGVRTIGIGGLASVMVDPAKVLQSVLLLPAKNFIITHNHPSGDPTPSEEDKAMTRRLAEAGQVANVKLLDHVVISISEYGEWKWFSMDPVQGFVRQSGTLPPSPLGETELVPSLYVMLEGRRFNVASIEDAQEKWNTFRDQSEAGASEIGNGVVVIDSNGQKVAKISYNGRIWLPGSKYFDGLDGLDHGGKKKSKALYYAVKVSGREVLYGIQDGKLVPWIFQNTATIDADQCDDCGQEFPDRFTTRIYTALRGDLICGKCNRIYKAQSVPVPDDALDGLDGVEDEDDGGDSSPT